MTVLRLTITIEKINRQILGTIMDYQLDASKRDDEVKMLRSRFTRQDYGKKFKNFA